jgi:hypothetical protein
VVGDIVTAPQNVQCSYVPHGNLDGSDGLTVFLYVYLLGASALPGSLSTSVSFSNGYSTVYSAAPSGTAQKALQGPIRATDWGHALTVHVAADPNDQYRETNETNNTIDVTVNLPATRPSQVVDPLPCSARSV